MRKDNRGERMKISEDGSKYKATLTYAESEIYITHPENTDVISTVAVFETTIRDTFEKEGLGHLEEEISEEIRHKKRMLEASFHEKNKIRFLIAKVGELTVGTVSFSSCGDIIRECTENELESVGELGSIFVLVDYQEKGIGSLLISSMIKELHSNGIERFCLDSGYKRAQKKWVKKFGEPYKIMKDYWGEGNDHMIWLCSVVKFMK